MNKLATFREKVLGSRNPSFSHLMIKLATAMVVISLAATGFGTYYFMHDALINRLDRENVAHLFRVARLIPHHGDAEAIPCNYVVLEIDPAGTLRKLHTPSDNTSLYPDISSMQQNVPAFLDKAQTFDSATSSSVRWRAMTVKNPLAEGYLMIAQNMSEVESIQRKLLQIFLTVCLIILLPIIFLSYRYAKRLVRPLACLEAAAAGVSENSETHDITVHTNVKEVNNLTESLNKMVGRLQEAIKLQHRAQSQLKQFIADASHELRTPLTTVSGYAQMYQLGAFTNEEQKHLALGKIRSESVRMNTLVEDLLQLTFDGPRNSTALSQVNLSTLAAQIVTDLNQSHQQRGEPIALEGPLEALYICAEEDKVRQVLINLLNNAINYTPAESTIKVLLSVSPAVTQENSSRVELKVIDNGPGIKDEDKQLVFERLYRVDKNRSKATGGTGLGLSIAKQLVEHLQGEIRLEDTPGGGATFIVSFIPSNECATRDNAERPSGV